MSVPRLFKLHQEALTERHERESEKKNERATALHKSLDSFSLFSFSLHPSSLFTHFPTSHPLLPSPCALSLSSLLFSTFLPPFLFLVCLDLIFPPAACQQVLTWLCSIEAKSVKCLAPWHHFHSLVSQRLAEHASKCDMSSVFVWEGGTSDLVQGRVWQNLCFAVIFVPS